MPVPNPADYIPQNMDHQSMIRALFGAHFVLVSVALLGHWMPSAYLLYNGFFLAGLVWVLASPSNSELPLLKCLCLNGLGIILDMFCMAAGYNGLGSWAGFSLAAAIVNLLLRLPSMLILYRVRTDRQRSHYEDWDGARSDVENPPPNYQPHSSAAPPGYTDFPRTGGLESSGSDTKPIAP